MRLPFATYGAKDLALSTLLCLAVAGGAGFFASERPWLWGVTGLALVVWALLVNFFRDPERDTPQGATLVISPADGVVKDFTDIDAPPHVGEPVTRIGIFLSPLDVHVNRMPMEGTVALVDYRRGKMLKAFDPRAIEENEAASTVLDIFGGKARLIVRQVTGAVARRIVCPVKPGDRFRAGERYGMIKFGSRTEVWLPKRLGVKWNVKLGDRVVAGLTVLATVEAPR